MAKILLVEDDNNLREIYEARLMAEGYDIVSARDGEEALTVAMKEKPDLIISDVMMPKISGFDMLDILRSTKETKDAKVIMMTALSQAEDKARAEKLGADRYLVKSQVTLEDVAKVAKEVLEGTGSPAAAAAAPLATAAASAAAPVAAATTLPQPVMDTPEPAAPAADTPQPEPTTAPAASPAPAIDPAPVTTPPVQPTAPAEPAPAASATTAAASTPQPTADPVAPAPPPAADQTVQQASDQAQQQENIEESGRKKTIQPLNDLHEDSTGKLKDLLQKEKQKEEMQAGIQETVAKHEATAPPVVPSESSDAPTPEAPVQPPAPESTIDPNSIAL